MVLSDKTITQAVHLPASPPTDHAHCNCSCSLLAPFPHMPNSNSDCKVRVRVELELCFLKSQSTFTLSNPALAKFGVGFNSSLNQVCACIMQNDGQWTDEFVSFFFVCNESKWASSFLSSNFLVSAVAFQTVICSCIGLCSLQKTCHLSLRHQVAKTAKLRGDSDRQMTVSEAPMRFGCRAGMCQINAQRHNLHISAPLMGQFWQRSQTIKGDRRWVMTLFPIFHKVEFLLDRHLSDFARSKQIRSILPRRNSLK